MLIGINRESLLNMTDQQHRWLNNLKKAFYDSDRLYGEGGPQECMEPMYKAVDTAKTLRRSLLCQDISSKKNAQRFKEFIDLEIPSRDRGGLLIPLVEARTGTSQEYSFSDLVYCIRCMVHENENLNASEAPTTMFYSTGNIQGPQCLALLKLAGLPAMGTWSGAGCGKSCRSSLQALMP